MIQLIGYFLPLFTAFALGRRFRPQKYSFLCEKHHKIGKKWHKDKKKYTFLGKKRKKSAKNLAEWRKVSTFAHANKERHVLC
jgi:hypothetical protein